MLKEKKNYHKTFALDMVFQTRIVCFVIVIISYLFASANDSEAEEVPFRASENNIYGSPLPKK